MTSILDFPILKDVILPFILVFVLIFAILQKSKLLGEGKARIDALVSLAISLILIITPPARIFIVTLVPWLAVGLAVMLVFLLLYGFVAEEGWKNQKWVKIVFGILAGIFVIGIVIYAGGFWSDLESFFSGGFNGSLGMNIFLIVIIAAVVILAIVGAKKSKSDK